MAEWTTATNFHTRILSARDVGAWHHCRDTACVLLLEWSNNGLLLYLSNNTHSNHKITLFAYEMHYTLANSLQFILSMARKLRNLHSVGWCVCVLGGPVSCAYTILITAPGTRPKIRNYVLINYMFRWKEKLIFSIVRSSYRRADFNIQKLRAPLNSLWSAHTRGNTVRVRARNSFIPF